MPFYDKTRDYSAFFVTQLGCDAVQELFEVDLATHGLKVSDHVENSRVFALEAETLHS